MSEVSVLLVGRTDRSEFRHAREALDDLGGRGLSQFSSDENGGGLSQFSSDENGTVPFLRAPFRIAAAVDIDQAAALLADGAIAPHAIVVAQAFPGQFSRQAIERLRRLAPLARVIGLLGSWCEGEMRTGEPWPAVIRVYWHQWGPRCAQELWRLLRGECSAWGLPATATEEERLLVKADSPRPSRQGLIAIHAGPFEMADWLSAACRSRGYSTVWLRPTPERMASEKPRGCNPWASPGVFGVQGATAAIFDGGDLNGGQLGKLTRLADALRPAPVVALLGFPRVEDVDRATAAGAAAVVSKPLHLSDLFWQLDAVLEE